MTNFLGYWFIYSWKSMSDMFKGKYVKLRALEEEDLKLLRDWRNSKHVRKTTREYKLLNMINQKKWFESIHTDNPPKHVMFGIVGKNDLRKTKGIKTRYKQYPDAAASFADFCRLMTTKKFYRKLKGNMNDKLWIDAISKAKYSEAPVEWKQRVTEAIRKNKLSATR